MERNKSGLFNIYKDYIRELSKNFLMGIPAVRRKRLQYMRTGSLQSSSDKFLEIYAFSPLNYLLKYFGEIKGRTICEIGAGDYLVSGLSMLAAGAKRYCVIDRFPGDYYGVQAKKWYMEIENSWSRFYEDISWNKNLRGADFPEKYIDKLELIAEPMEVANPKDKFDIICSFQVGEHVSDIHEFARIHQRLMKDDGVGIHRVDFGPHDCWFYYQDPMTFLRFSDRAWKLTSTNRGTPNRCRHHEFIEAFEKSNLKVEILYKELFDEKKVDFSSLNKKFREMPRDSILVGTVIYRLSKK